MYCEIYAMDQLARDNRFFCLCVQSLVFTLNSLWPIGTIWRHRTRSTQKPLDLFLSVWRARWSSATKEDRNFSISFHFARMIKSIFCRLKHCLWAPIRPPLKPVTTKITNSTKPPNIERKQLEFSNFYWPQRKSVGLVVYVLLYTVQYTTWAMVDIAQCVNCLGTYTPITCSHPVLEPRE